MAARRRTRTPATRRRPPVKLQGQLCDTAFVAQIESALVGEVPLADGLRGCAEAMVRQLDAALAGIWTLDPAEQVLVLQASAGLATNLEARYARVSVGQSMIGLIAQERKPHLTNQVVGDPLILDQEWARREGLVAFAGYPLETAGRVVGVLAMFARQPLSDDLPQALQTAARTIAMFIARERVQRELALARDILRLVVDNIPAYVFWKDRQSRYLGCNRLFAQAAGVGEPAAIVGKTDFDLAWRDTAERYHADDREVMERGRPKLHYEEPQTRPDGSLRWLRTSKVPLTHQDGTVFGVLGIYEDITEQKELEANAARLERLAMLGQLLSGVAHEIKNPLFILTGYLQLLKEKLHSPAGADLLADLQKIEDAAGRLAKITERFLQLARGTSPQQTWVSVEAVLRATLEFLANELMRKQICVVTEIAAALPPVWADPGRLQEVFLNLILNAVQAMTAAHGKGTLTVSAKLAASHEQPAASEEKLSVASDSRSAPEPSWIEVRIQDDGPGIPPDHQARLFEPFFSTKPPGEGSGLGLWIVRSNLAAIGGLAQCESEVGRGATFIVRLPVAGESRQPSAGSDRTGQ